MPLTDALIVPGYGDITNHDYRFIEESFAAVGIRPRFVPIDWQDAEGRDTNIHEGIAQFEATYLQYDPSKTVVMGFSLGSMYAAVALAKRCSQVYIAASTAPWFSEDIPLRSAEHKRVIGEERLSMYAQTSFTAISSRITATTHIFVGSQEIAGTPAFGTRAVDMRRRIPGSTLRLIPGAPHDITHPRYKTALQRTIAGLQDY